MKDFEYRGWLTVNENRYECLVCGGFYLAKNIKDLRSWHKHFHKCFKCGESFISKFDLDTDKPTCDKCFSELLKVKSGKEYQDFIENLI